METPLSSRRVTRSQTADSSKNSMENSKSEKTRHLTSYKKGQDRSAFMDITNDSPIVGLAIGGTPSSTMSKKKTHSKKTGTPGSGEALLRGQVKSLLQKVEEAAAEFSTPLFNHSPMAPNPTKISNLGSDSTNCLPCVTPSQNYEVVMIIPNSGEKQDDTDKCVVTRSLFMDFLDGCDSSFLTYQGEESSKVKQMWTDEDDVSIWSIQANASSTRGGNDYEEEDLLVEQEFDDYADEVANDYDEGMVDELCEGMMKRLQETNTFRV